MHIDMNSFYASVEMRENPSLKDKALIIGAEPKEGKGRGVVVTCNYIARKFNVKSGMPISYAYKLCPNATYLPPNMQLYIETSERIMSILREFSKRFEQVSIDEAFLDLSDLGDFNSAKALALNIKKNLKEKEELTCSIGIGENKLIAKISSDIKKPDGLTIVMPEDKGEFLAPLSIEKIPGIGPKTKERLGDIGIKTIGDLQKKGKALLINLLGDNYGRWLYEQAHGIDNTVVEENYEIKSINRNITFEEDTTDINLMHSIILEMANDVHNTLIANNLSYKTVTLRVRYDNFQTVTKAKSLQYYSNDFTTIVKICNKLLVEFLGKRKTRQLGVRLSNLASMNNKQKSILEF